MSADDPSGEPDDLQPAAEALGGKCVGFVLRHPERLPVVVLRGPRRIEHLVGDRERLRERPLDRLAVAIVGVRHLGEEDRPEGDVPVLVAGDDYLFRASDLPGVGAEQDYQLWVVAADGSVAPADVLEDRDGTVEQLVQDVPGVGVAVTVEPEGGSEQPTSDPIVALVT